MHGMTDVQKILLDWVRSELLELASLLRRNTEASSIRVRMLCYVACLKMDKPLMHYQETVVLF